MITVTFKEKPIRSGQRQENTIFFVTEVINSRLPLRSHVWHPPTDVYEMEDRVIVLVEIAGMDESSFSIFLDRSNLRISGSRAEPETDRKAFHQMEIRFGEFSTEVELSVQIELEKAVAEYRNGFLRVTLPKAQPKQIRVNED